MCSSSKNVGKEACSGVCKKLSSVSASTSRGKTSAGKAQVDYLRNTGVESKSQDFCTQLFQLHAPRGAQGLRRDTPQTHKNVIVMLTEGMLIPFHRL